MVSGSATPTPIPIVATQRRLIAGILVSTLLILAIVIAVFATGGRPDPAPLRAAARLLDGSWRFRIGDDPRWADPGTADFAWEAIDMTAVPGSHDGDVGLPDHVAGWMAHGHAGYRGYAWYRREVTLPLGAASWDILGPTLVEDGYELYWNGQRLGGSGRLGPAPRVVGTRPLQFTLPVDAPGTRGILAVRAYMHPSSGVSAEAGGMHNAPLLAPRPIADALHRVQWERTIAGYIVDVLEPLAMLALIGLALWCLPQSGHRGFLICASIALAFMATRRLTNAIVAWTDWLDLASYAWLASVMWVPAIAAWTLAWNRRAQRPWRIVDVSAAVLACLGIVGAVTHSVSVTSGSRIGSIVLMGLAGARIVRSDPLRILAGVTLASIMAALFGDELLDPIRVPGIWFPFGIGVSRTQYAYAVAIPLLALLFVRGLALGAAMPDGTGKEPQR